MCIMKRLFYLIIAMALFSACDKTESGNDQIIISDNSQFEWEFVAATANFTYSVTKNGVVIVEETAVNGTTVKGALFVNYGDNVNIQFKTQNFDNKYLTVYINKQLYFERESSAMQWGHSIDLLYD